MVLLAVHEADPNCVGQGLVHLHGAVGVSQWGGEVPRLVHLRQKEKPH